MPLFSVGHSTLAKGDFLALLRGADVVVDVRSSPHSTRYPHFNREALAQWLPAAGFAYRWVPDLGGWTGRHAHLAASFRQYGVDVSAYGGAFRKGLRSEKRQPSADTGSWQSRGFYDYSFVMTLSPWQEAAQALLQEAAFLDQPALALLCAEALWWRCHRSMIADYMVWRGYDVIHLQPAPVRHTAVMDSRLTRYHPAVIAAWEAWTDGG